ncbi:MAG: hypothetical protein AAF502_02720 [Bacteroidota bacterium]
MHINRFFVLFACLLISVAAVGQASPPQDNSPYSRYGIGNLLPQYFAPQGAMGGISTAYNSFYHLNPSNPASYAALSYTAFEAGLYYKFTNVNSEAGSVNTNTGNLSYIALGFPIFNPLNRATLAKDKPVDWGMSFGLKPFSQVAYDIAQTGEIDSIGTVNYLFQGNGQLYKLYYGTGIRYKGFSAGFNIGLLFGNTSQLRRVEFDDLVNAFLDDLNDNTNHSGFIYDIGLQYEYVFGKLEDPEEERKRRSKRRLLIGLRGNGTYKVRTNSVQNYQRAALGYGLDTISFSEELTGRAKMPAEVSIGLAMKQDGKWMIGGDFTWSGWGSFEHPNLIAPLEDAWRVSIGGEYTPNERSFKNYFYRIRYRAGAFYALDPRVVGGEQLTTYGVTFGMGFPVKANPQKKPSFINLGFEFGRLGDSDLIMENYFRLNLAFTFNDNSWFFKRKFR